MKYYAESKTLVKVTTRMAKDFSSFFYFILESNENSFFYSTLSFEKGQSFRDIVVYMTPEFESSFKSLIQTSAISKNITVMNHNIIKDEVS